MQGRRLPDASIGSFPIEYDDLQPGDYWFVTVREKQPDYPRRLNVRDHPDGQRWWGNDPPDPRFAQNLTGHVLGIITPDHRYGQLCIHTVRERGRRHSLGASWRRVLELDSRERRGATRAVARLHRARRLAGVLTMTRHQGVYFASAIAVTGLLTELAWFAIDPKGDARQHLLDRGVRLLERAARLVKI